MDTEAFEIGGSTFVFSTCIKYQWDGIQKKTYVIFHRHSSSKTITLIILKKLSHSARVND